MHRNAVPESRRNLSGIGQFGVVRCVVAKATTRPAWGCKGLSSLCSSAPCPSAVPCLFAHDCSLGLDARRCSLRLRGKGCAPCTPARYLLARRLRVGKLAITIASAIQGGLDADDSGASRVRRIFTSFHPITMKDLIQNFVQEHGASDSSIADELVQDGCISDATPVHTIVRERFRIRVFRGKEHDQDGSQAKHWIALEFLAGGQWKTWIALEERNLQHVYSGLNKLFDFLESQNSGSPDALSKVICRLPEVTIFGDRWYIDEKLRQLRKVEAPEEFINLD
jgi:hypothetical protein